MRHFVPSIAIEVQIALFFTAIVCQCGYLEVYGERYEIKAQQKEKISDAILIPLGASNPGFMFAMQSQNPIFAAISLKGKKCIE